MTPTEQNDETAPSATPPLVELLAERLYGVVMQATADQWLTWEHASQADRSGYYDEAYDLAEHVLALRLSRPGQSGEVS